MKKFETTDIVQVKGSDTIYIVKIPNPDRLRRSPNLPEKDEIVLINKEKKKITGIAASFKLTSPPFMDEDVGFLAIDIKEEIK